MVVKYIWYDATSFKISLSTIFRWPHFSQTIYTSTLHLYFKMFQASLFGVQRATWIFFICFTILLKFSLVRQFFGGQVCSKDKPKYYALVLQNVLNEPFFVVNKPVAYFDMMHRYWNLLVNGISMPILLKRYIQVLYTCSSKCSKKPVFSIRQASCIFFLYDALLLKICMPIIFHWTFCSNDIRRYSALVVKNVQDKPFFFIPQASWIFLISCANKCNGHNF